MSGAKNEYYETKAENKLNVDIQYLQRTYFNLRSNLLLELNNDLEKEDYGPAEKETLVRKLDMNLNAIMSNIISQCNIIDLPTMEFDFSDPKAVLDLLVPNTDIIDKVLKDEALQKDLNSEFSRFDDLCIRKGELLKELKEFNETLVERGSSISEEYLLNIDLRIKNLLDPASIPSAPETNDDIFLENKLNEYLKVLSESMANINQLETDNSMPNLQLKFKALQSKIEYIMEKLDR